MNPWCILLAKMTDCIDLSLIVDELIKRFLKPPFLILKIRYPAVNSLDSHEDSMHVRNWCVYPCSGRVLPCSGQVLTHCLLMVKSAMIIT